MLVLLEQPEEIIFGVLQWLSVRDLLNLRQVNHTFHKVVHEHEGSICASYCRSLEAQDPAFRLPPLVHGETLDLLHYSDLQYRYESLRDLTSVLTGHITAYLVHSGITNEEAIETMRVRKRWNFAKNLLPGLFLLNNYLESLKRVMIDAENAFSTWDDEEYVANKDVFMLDQQRIIEDLCRTPDKIVDMFIAWMVFRGICTAKRLSFSYKYPYHPFPTLKRILLHRGLPCTTELISGDRTDTATRQTFEKKISDVAWCSQRHFWHNRAELPSIHHLRVHRRCVAHLSMNRRHTVVNKFLDGQRLVSRAVFAVLQRHGGVESGDLGAQSNRWLMSRICDIGEDISPYKLLNW